MKYNKIIIPFIISTMTLFVFFACYPGMGPGAKGGKEDQKPKDGELVTITSLEDSIVMTVGDTYGKLTVSITQDGNPVSGAPRFTSSDLGVASVDSSGRITGISLGDTIITISSASGAGKTYFPVHVREIVVNSQANSIAAGMDPVPMFATLSPGGETLESAITWSVKENYETTADTGKASTITTDGKLSTARTDGGTVDVIASSTYGSTSGTTHQGDKLVNIIDTTGGGSTEIESVVTISSTKKPLAAVNDTMVLSAAVFDPGTSPANASGIVWTVSPAGAVTFSATTGASTIITVRQVGDLTITATSSDGGSSTFTVNARGLQILPADASLSLSLLGTVLGGLAGGEVQLSAELTGGTKVGNASTVEWTITDDSTLSLLTSIEISASGLLSAEAGLLGILGVLSIGNVTVQASFPDNGLKADIVIPVVSVL